MYRGHLLSMIGVIYWVWTIFLPSTCSIYLSLRNFSRYWVDMVFAFNATVTLTFFLLNSIFIGVSYWVWPIFLPCIMTVTHKYLKILSRHGLCIKWYCDLDLWPCDLNICKGHLLSMTNLPTMYHDCHS